MRTLSGTALSAVLAQETDKVFAVLCKIEHPQIPATDYFPAGVLRFNNAGVQLTHAGETYEPWPFDVVLPEESDDAPPRAQLTIDAVDRTVIQAIRSLSTAPTVIMTVVLASSPDTIEAGPWEMTLRDIEYDAQNVRGTLSYDDFFQEPFPAGTYNPIDYPALFP